MIMQELVLTMTGEDSGVYEVKTVSSDADTQGAAR